MSKLDELIQELCPDGVVYKKLGDLIKIEKGKQLNKTHLFDKYEENLYPVINGGISPSGFWNEYNYSENLITISQGGASAGYVNYIKTKFWAGAHCYIVASFNDDIIYRYIYHFLKSKEIELKNSQVGAGIPSVSLKDINSLRFPVPPLEVQCEIVRILDKFTLLTAELTAELTARRKQYEYYRKKLFEEVVEKSEIMKIQDISKNISSGGTPSTSITEYYNGEIPWLRTQEVNFNEIWDTKVKITNLALQNSSVKMIPANCVIVAMYGATVGRAGINKIPLTTNQACCNIEINEIKANYKYLFYWLLEKYDHIKSLGQGSQTNINSNIIKKLELPIPSLQEQIKIVDILDRFDKLCNDITSGLPAEIELNNKRYEYYRDKLLTFKEKK